MLLDGVFVVLDEVLEVEEVLEFVELEEVYIKLEFEFEFEFGVSHLNFNVPVAASSPNTYNNIVTIDNLTCLNIQNE